MYFVRKIGALSLVALVSVPGVSLADVTDAQIVTSKAYVDAGDNARVPINQGAENANKVMRVDATGNVATQTVDAAVTENSANLVTSGAVYTIAATKQDTLTFDDTPTENSVNPVKSGGVYSYAVAKNQGTENANKGLVVGADGNLALGQILQEVGTDTLVGDGYFVNSVSVDDDGKTINVERTTIMVPLTSTESPTGFASIWLQ